MASRKPQDLTPALEEIHRVWLINCTEAGLNVITTCTARSFQEQMSLYAQGRQPLDEVNRLRFLAGLPPITEKENSYKVTWTMASKHIVNLYDDLPNNDKAYAFDFAIVKDKKVIWDVKVSLDGDDLPDYQEAGEIGESLGLKWGGRWKSPDYPHLELIV
jgi:peptidoglycan L-alanyl-D-glutamate endopeptidase CwlK